MKMIYLLMLMVTITISGSVLEAKWKLWKSHYAKSYLNEAEELLRRQIWETNLEKVTQHNNRADDGKESYRLEMNRFADMTIEELAQDNELMSWDTEELPVGTQEVNEPVPEEVDWRVNGCVTVVMDQRQCNSCWAIVAVGTIESRLCVKHGYLFNLSVQQLVDCVSRNDSCVSGNRRRAFKYIQTNEGLMNNSDYPYTALKGHCNLNESRIVKVNISNIAKVNANRIAEDIANYGPTSARLFIPNHFHLYTAGIYSNPDCHNATYNHSVIIIGYTPDYWIVKNSWGKDWGEKGYAYFKRGVNMCRIEDRVLSPYLQ